jgi:BNR repeat protein
MSARRRLTIVVGLVALAIAGATCQAAADSAVTISSPPTRLAVSAQHSAFPSLAATPAGLELVWRQGTDHATTRDGKIMHAASHDQGETFGEVSVLRQGGDYRDPNLSADGQHLTWFVGSSTKPAMGAYTQQQGWAPTARIEALPYAAISSPVIRLPDGRLGTAFYGRCAGETVDTAWMAWSSDNGLHWTTNRIANGVGAHYAYTEPWLVRDGSMTDMFFRSGPTSIGMRSSTDSGKTQWGPIRTILTNATGRPTTFVTSSGVLVMVYRRASDKAAQVAYSTDHASTWQLGPTLLTPPAGSPNGMTYAAMVETSPGMVRVVFGMESSLTSSSLYTATLAVQ